MIWPTSKQTNMIEQGGLRLKITRKSIFFFTHLFYNYTFNSMELNLEVQYNGIFNKTNKFSIKKELSTEMIDFCT